MDTDEDLPFFQPLDLISKDVNELQEMLRERKKKERDKERFKENEKEKIIMFLLATLMTADKIHKFI